MPIWNRKSGPADRISPRALADFGRFQFLGAEQSGIDATGSYDLISSLNELVFTSYPADRARVITELRRHAMQGEWEKVGAWKYVRDFLSEAPDTQDLIDGGLLAIHRMRITNLSIHLAPIDTPRYIELTGSPPANDGFFGPPVFDSSFGPTRQYYFDQAVAASAARAVTRLPSLPGVEPGPVTEAARAMWDFGMLIYCGPLVVNPDLAFEPNVVRRAIEAASNVDHSMFTDRLAEAVLNSDSRVHGPWSSIGGARFVEDYLDATAVQAAGYSRMLDSGLILLIRSGMLGVLMTPQTLTTRQRERLASLHTSQQ